MQASVLLPLWRSGDIESLAHLLAEYATLSSPVTDYHGRAQAVLCPYSTLGEAIARLRDLLGESPLLRSTT
jgi:hypothetical protein